MWNTSIKNTKRWVICVVNEKKNEILIREIPISNERRRGVRINGFIIKITEGVSACRVLSAARIARSYSWLRCGYLLDQTQNGPRRNLGEGNEMRCAQGRRLWPVPKVNTKKRSLATMTMPMRHACMQLVVRAMRVAGSLSNVILPLCYYITHCTSARIACSMCNVYTLYCFITAH